MTLTAGSSTNDSRTKKAETRHAGKLSPVAFGHFTTWTFMTIPSKLISYGTLFHRAGIDSTCELCAMTERMRDGGRLNPGMPPRLPYPTRRPICRLVVDGQDEPQP